MKDRIQRAIENERIALRRYRKAVKDGIKIPYYKGRIKGSENCIRRLEELLSVSSHETPKVRINKQTKEVKKCKHSYECFSVNFECPHLDDRSVECF